MHPGEEYIVAITTQALVTGTYFATFLLCLRWLVFSDDGGTLRKRINWPFLIITVILFAFAVTDFSISLRSLLLVFEDENIGFYLIVLNGFVDMLSYIITDSVLIFRCWVVYNRSWRIIVLPFLLLLYNISTLIMMTYWNATTTGAVSTGFDDQLLGIQGSYLASTIIINIYATSAIVVKIWRNTVSRHLCRFTIRVVAESGLLYTITSIVTFCMLLLPVPGFLIATAIDLPVSGIAYHLILIRVAQNRAKPEERRMSSLMLGDSTIERAVPTIPRHHPQSVVPHEMDSRMSHSWPLNCYRSTFY
ncbi:hypothetical protein F5887DRAFT_78468 [Amanita rubescens]|nr:hypothetical protein F5887DRAFT_78468 [Amanita rubescens]